MKDHNKDKYYKIENFGIRNVGRIIRNPSTPVLYEEIVRRREGYIAHLGPVVVRTGHHTGRSPNDKFIVKEPTSEDKIWWGEVNRPFDSYKFDILYYRVLAYLQGKDIFIQDCFAGTDPKYRIPISVITEDAWHNLFARNIFVQANETDLTKQHIPQFIIINLPNFHAVKELDGTNSDAFIIVNFGKKIILVGGTSYAGEIKKAVFTIMNYLMPQEHVFTMHSSANIGKKNDVAIFFGLSGTGKTSLSADVDRALIGDDEHGWSEKGIFNIEGGCYAKVVRLSEEKEPVIFDNTSRFGTVLENVGFNTKTRRVDLDDATLTENTRAAYPIANIHNAHKSGMAGHPKNIILLTCDAFGVMPPISQLTKEQTMYHFLSGYTAKIAGTEKGMGKDPVATFSACYGAPFMALPPIVYTRLLGEKIEKHSVKCWLINTGWSGGPFGVGSRINIAHSRAMIRAALSGELDQVDTVIDPIFRLKIPVTCPGVPGKILIPSKTWKDESIFRSKALELAVAFKDNFEKIGGEIPDAVREAGPKGVPSKKHILSK